MSLHRENVIWVSRDGKWNRGFYEYYNVNVGGEDWDHEWDVEYIYDSFNWVSTGHATEEAANMAWTGSNPGSAEIISEASAETDRLDAMAAEFKQRG